MKLPSSKSFTRVYGGSAINDAPSLGADAGEGGYPAGGEGGYPAGGGATVRAVIAAADIHAVPKLGRYGVRRARSARERRS